jgi:nucleoside 2-deoxyribosyltransferase
LDIKNIEPNKVFLGTPMASLDPLTYKENREGIIQIIEAIKGHTKFENIYSPIINKPTQKDFDGKEFSVEKDFSQLKSSEYYIFVYPVKALSSILIEIGYAIALMKKTLIFVKDKSDLPFMLERADYRNNNVKIYDFKDFNDLKQQICDDGNYIFDF